MKVVCKKYQAIDEFSKRGLIMHKFYLANEVLDKGLKVALQNRDEVDLDFLRSLKGKDIDDVKRQLILELRQL